MQLRTAKRLGSMLTLLMLLLAVGTVLCSCSKAVCSVSVSISVAESPFTEVSSVYDNPKYEYEPGSPTIFGVLSALADDGIITFGVYGYDCRINGIGFNEPLDGSYTQGWSILLNGLRAEDGVYTAITDGDSITLVYNTTILE